MTIQEKMLMFAKNYPKQFIDTNNCPTFTTSCHDCLYAWGDSTELCPLDDEIPYVKEIKLSIIENHPEIFI